MIKRITSKDDFCELSELLNKAFLTVAAEYDLTKENCPTNNAFINAEELEKQLADNTEFYCFFQKGKAIGFIAIEKSSKEKRLFYIEKVAVHPDFRHKGIGIQLMEFAIKQIKEKGGRTISIGVINANIRLKKWYSMQGFVEVAVKTFNHLPFDVCYMEKNID